MSVLSMLKLYFHPAESGRRILFLEPPLTSLWTLASRDAFIADEWAFWEARDWKSLLLVSSCSALAMC